jgi:hypothetical protein
MATACDLPLGLGSGLSQRPGEPKATIWAITDRGPNLKIKSAIKRYGLEHLRQLAKVDGAKVMPRPDIGHNLPAPMPCSRARSPILAWRRSSVAGTCEFGNSIP